MILASEGEFTIDQLEAEKKFGFIKLKDLIDRLTVPGFDPSKDKKTQVIAYLAGLPEERTKVIFQKIKPDMDYVPFIAAVGTARAEAAKASQPPKPEMAASVMGALGFGTMAAGAELTRRAEVLINGTTQEYFGDTGFKAILHAVKMTLDQELQAGDLHLNSELDGSNTMVLSLSDESGNHLLTVKVGKSTRLSQLSPDLPMDVTTVQVSKSNHELLLAFAGRHAEKFLDEVDHVLDDGKVDLMEGATLVLKGWERATKVVKKASLADQVFGAINKFLVEAEQKYNQDRQVKIAKIYEAAKAEKDARICAGCGVEKVEDRSDCGRCGMPYSTTS